MARDLVAKEQRRLLREQTEREAWLGRQLLVLLGVVRICNLYHTGDTIRAEVTDVRGRHRSCEEADVRDLLVAAAGMEPQKQCRGPCGRVLPASAYAHDANRPDGRLLRCKRCEAERVKQYKGTRSTAR
jgi:hypothetical protein